MITTMPTFTLLWRLEQPLTPEIAEYWVKAYIQTIEETMKDFQDHFVGFLLVKPMNAAYLTFDSPESMEEARFAMRAIEKNQKQLIRRILDERGTNRNER